MLSAGFDIADSTHPRYPNEWRDDPPVGLVRVKGVWLPDAHVDDDPDPDGRVTFSLTERWSTDEPLVQPEAREGLWLAGYGYNGHIAGDYGPAGRCNHRHDFDLEKDPDIFFHRHPLGMPDNVRKPEDRLSPDAALSDFLNVLDEEINSGRFS